MIEPTSLASVVINTLLDPLHLAKFHLYSASNFGVSSWLDEIGHCQIEHSNYTAWFTLGLLLKLIFLIWLYTGQLSSTNYDCSLWTSMLLYIFFFIFLTFIVLIWKIGISWRLWPTVTTQLLLGLWFLLLISWLSKQQLSSTDTLFFHGYRLTEPLKNSYYLASVSFNE